jgi:hypothetical protein
MALELTAEGPAAILRTKIQELLEKLSRRTEAIFPPNMALQLTA